MNRSRNKRPRNASAFLFIELLVILGLLGVAALVSSRLFNASMRSIITARASEDRQLSIDNMTAALRRDAWTAKSVQVPDGKTIVITTNGGKTIRWNFETASATRTSDRETHWAVPEMQTKLDHASVVLQSKDFTQRFIVPMMLASQGGAK